MNGAAFLRRHPAATYYALVFLLSWTLILLVIGPEEFVGARPLAPSQMLLVVFMAPLLGPTTAGIVTASLVYGRAGIHDIRLRLFRWRLSPRWYALALFTAPALTVTILFGLSLISPLFLPTIVTAGDKVSLVAIGVVAGLLVPSMEELGWTGFAIPELRKTRSVLVTGLIVGILWGTWHAPLFSGEAVNSSGGVPPVLFLAVLLFTWLPAYRTLMIWAYDHTKSILLMILMHFPIVFGSLVLTPAALGTTAVIFDLILATSLWILVAAALFRDRQRASQSALRPTKNSNPL